MFQMTSTPNERPKRKFVNELKNLTLDSANHSSSSELRSSSRRLARASGGAKSLSQRSSGAIVRRIRGQTENTVTTRARRSLNPAQRSPLPYNVTATPESNHLAKKRQKSVAKRFTMIKKRSAVREANVEGGSADHAVSPTASSIVSPTASPASSVGQLSVSLVRLPPSFLLSNPSKEAMRPPSAAPSYNIHKFTENSLTGRRYLRGRGRGRSRKGRRNQFQLENNEVICDSSLKRAVTATPPREILSCSPLNTDGERTPLKPRGDDSMHFDLTEEDDDPPEVVKTAQVNKICPVFCP